jgi:hypothetical protein
MASEIWEIVKGFGSIAGLVTGAFVVWDRFWRHTPQAIIVPRPLMEGSVNIVARLAVKNLAPRPILLAWDNDGRPAHLRIAKDDSIHGVVSSQFPGRRTIVLDVGEVREFDLLRPANYFDLASEDWLHVEVSWKFPQPILWQPEHKLRIGIKKQDFRILTGDDSENDEDV